MANSTSNLDLVSASQLNPEVTVNAALDAASPAMLYGRRAITTAALTWGYYGGTVSISGTPTQVANGTVTLAASATNYIEANPATGAVTVNQTGFTAGRMPLYSVVTGTTTAESYTDLRVLGGGAGSGTVRSVNTKTPDGSGAVTLSASDVGADASGSAAAAISAHDSAADPHPQYLTPSEADARYAPATAATGVSSVNTRTGAVTLTAADVGADASGAAASAVSAHAAAADPHGQYLTQARGDARYPLLSAEGQANGLATLGADGKLTAAQVPDIAIVDYLGTVASQFFMLALTGQKGDWCIRSDDGKVYTITGSDPTQASSWTAMSYPVGNGGTVTSVDLSVPGLLYTVSGNPVTTSGTLTFSLKTQAANTFLAGPASGSAAAPTMRTITGADLPVFGASGAGHAPGAVPDPGSTAGTTRFLREDGSWQAPPSGSTPGGGTTQIQFNDGGTLSGITSLTWDKTNNILYVGPSSGSARIQGAAPSTATSNGTSVTIQGGNGGATSGNGGDLILKSGGVGVNGSAGTLQLLGADATSSANKGGSILIQSGNSGAQTSAAGGDITIKCGTSNNGFSTGTVTIGNDSNGGAVVVKGGAQSSVTAGAVTVQGGQANTASTGGALTLAGGDGNNGGATTLRGGDGTFGPSVGGNLTIRAGNSYRPSNAGATAPGAITVNGGNATGANNSAAGGAVSITGGQGGAISGVGGAVNISGGAPQADNGGSVNISGAAGVGANKNGGSVTLTPGAATGTGTPGNVVLNGSGAALATTAVGGFVCVPTMAGAPTGVPANVPAGTVPMVLDTANKKIWMYIAGTWVGVTLA